MKQDIVQLTKETVGRIESRLAKNERSIAEIEKRIDDGENKVADRVVGR